MKTIRMTSMARRCLALGVAYIPWGQTAVELWDEPPKDEAAPVSQEAWDALGDWVLLANCHKKEKGL